MRVAKTKNAVDILAHHCVSLHWIDQEVESHGLYLPATTDYHSVSAFVASVRGRWFLITAGHVLRDIDARLASGRKMTSCGICDGWSTASPHRNDVPFDYQNAFRNSFGDECGVDFAFIELPLLVEACLKANGIRPLTEEHWVAVPRDLEYHYMAGLPSERKSVQKRSVLTGTYYKQNASLILMPVRREGNPPEELLKQPNRFFGKLVDDASDADSERLGDIVGMSGGPIFGFYDDFDKTRKYWLEAVQSSWLPTARVIAGCYAEPVLTSMWEVIARLEEFAAEALAHRSE